MKRFLILAIVLLGLALLAPSAQDQYGSAAWRSLRLLYGGTLCLTSPCNLAVGTISFEGATADDFETTISVTDPTADRTFTLPNAASVAVQPADCAPNNVKAISAAGVITCGP